jgi:5-methylcytosine-specific restriction protein A
MKKQMQRRTKKITEQMVERSYEIGKKIRMKELTLTDGVNALVNIGMNKASALDYIYNYKKLTSGEKFIRTTNAYATNYFLEKIFHDEGREGLKTALKSLAGHISYYETKSTGKVKTRKEIHDRFLEKIK